MHNFSSYYFLICQNILRFVYIKSINHRFSYEYIFIKFKFQNLKKIQFRNLIWGNRIFLHIDEYYKLS